MKKILFIQNNGSTSGGVWSVNKTLALDFQKKNYEVLILSIRELFNEEVVPSNLKTHTINCKDLWKVPNCSDIKSSLKHLNFFKAIKQFIKNRKRVFDIKKTRRFIENYHPDYIIASHYQVLDGIPSEYLKKTFNVHHSSFEQFLNNRANISTFFKYNGLINFCWLSKNTMTKANDYGLRNNYYVYNPVKFQSTEIADVVKNKKLIVLTRLVEEKRIDLMIKMVESIFEDSKYKDWKLEIYGTGVLESQIKKFITNKHQVFLKDVTNNAKEVYLTASINLNTSSFEGFPMSILEANECGLPTISFDYGESAKEQIINGKTGFVVKQNDIDLYVKNLKLLMDDENLLLEMSKACKKHNAIFNGEKVINDWQNLFSRVENNKDI